MSDRFYMIRCFVDHNLVAEMYAVPAIPWHSLPSSFSATPRHQAPPSSMYAAGTTAPTQQSEAIQNDQLSYGELVQNKKIMFDLSKWGQHLRRSGLTTEMRIHNHELSRVQRYVVPTSSRDNGTDALIDRPSSLNENHPYSSPHSGYPVQGTGHAATSPAWQGYQTQTYIPDRVSSRSDAQRYDDAGSYTTPPTTSPNMSWNNTQHQHQSYNYNQCAPTPSTSSSFPTSSNATVQSPSQVTTYQGDFRYINPQERAFQPPPGVSIERFQSCDYHVQNCPANSLCALIPSLPPIKPSNRSQNHVPHLKSRPGPSSERLQSSKISYVA